MAVVGHRCPSRQNGILRKAGNRLDHVDLEVHRTRPSKAQELVGTILGIRPLRPSLFSSPLA